MEMIMKKEKHSGDKITEQTLHEILLDIKYRLEHIEDITADDRTLIVKLIKQSNTVVEFLRDLQIDEVVEDYSPLEQSRESEERAEKLKVLLDEFLDKKESLKELEKELKKHRLMITPGQVGEA
tara:strand:- start:364 stop:735 length:372 start_codon:yes stop_codon:yes gene_type:complete